MIRLVLPMLLALLVASCTANRVQDRTLLPAVQSAWPGVREEIEAAPPAVEVSAVELDLVEERLMSGQRVRIRQIEWLPLEVAAQAGIEQQILDGVISEGVALSLRERLDRFRDALLELQEID